MQLSALLLSFLLLAPVEPARTSDAPLGEAFFETVAGTEAIANGVVTALAQDARGLLWIGTTEGLWSYDGYRLRSLRHDAGRDDSLADDYVRALLARPDGSLWVATQSAGISILDPTGSSFHHLRHDPKDPHSLASHVPVVLAEAPDGAIWVGTGDAGLDRWDPASQRFQHFRHQPEATGSLSHDVVRSLLFDRHGDLWIGTGDGLNRLRHDSQQFERIASDPADPASLAGLYIYALFESADGQLWIGTQTEGAARLRPDTGELLRLPHGGPAGLSHPWIDGFAEPQPGRIWVASFGGGIDVLDAASAGLEQRLQHDPAIPGSLALDRIIAPFKDRAGLLWIGTWGGGLQWHNPANASTFRSLRHSPARPHGLSHSTVLSMLELADGRIWIGTGGNGIDVLDRHGQLLEGLRPSDSPGGLRDGTVRALAGDADGSVWVGTQQAGLLHYRPGQSTFEPLVASLPDQRIRRLLRSKAGALLIGTQRGLVQLDPATLQTEVLLRADKGTALAAPIWSLAEDGAGRLWVSTPEALWWRAPGETRLQELKVGAPTGVTDMRSDRAGLLWTLGSNGLHRLQDIHAATPMFTRWTAHGMGVPSACGREFQIDTQDRLWTSRCLIDPASQQMHAFGRAEGVDIGNVEMGASGRTAAGLMLFGGTRGLLLIDPARYQPWDFEPPLLVTGIDIDGQSQSLATLAAGLKLQPGQSRFSVEFAALDYTAPQHIQYAYQLQGLDPDWINSDADRRVATYNNLWPGDYQLKIRGSNRSGVWSPLQLEIPLRVLPAWWQSLWVVLVAGLLLTAGIVWAVNRRTARIRQRAQQLERLVDARTAELSNAKDSAEAALAQLKTAQRQLVAAEKMASLGQLVAGVAHEINTPIGIAVTAASHLEEVSREQGNRLESGRLSRQDLGHWQHTVTEASRLILGSLERASTLVRSFKQVAVDQSSEQRRRFVLDQFLGEVKNAMLPSFRHSPHRLDIECPAGLELDSYPGALFQILSNLIANALLHAFAEGSSGTMRIQVSTHEDRAILSFSDDGQGMSAEVVNRAFDPFFTTRRGSGGSGLGLHLVHNLTTQMLGGQIELRSREGHGTEVRLDLPLVAPGKLG